MVTQFHSSRLWIAGLVCLLATSASAQERTAHYNAADQARGNPIRPVTHWGNGYHQTPGHYSNQWAHYAPGSNVYANHRDPNRGFVAYSYTRRIPAKRNRPDDCTKGDRCFLGFLGNWDAGYQCDIIALDPGYTHPNDFNQGYAAQGYGGPVSVPQAPNVRSNFNYGWGIPSSRLTPTSLPARY